MNDTVQNKPPGWDYNPSEWSQRLPLVAVALLGFCIALYLALYQWRVIQTIWEPFFGTGSKVILNSSVSRLLPLPDAAFGAIGYLADAIAGLIGGNKRWRTMPWVVIFFGLLVGPLGLVSIVLVILQPTYFGAWCTLCLASAVISLALIYPAMDEVVAGYQFLKSEKQAGKSLWRAFWGLNNNY